MREIAHLQAGQCGNQIGAKVFITNLIRQRSNAENCVYTILSRNAKRFEFFNFLSFFVNFYYAYSY